MRSWLMLALLAPAACEPGETRPADKSAAPVAAKPAESAPTAAPPPAAPSNLVPDDRATAFVESWITDVRAGVSSADALLAGADLSVSSQLCGTTPVCAGRALKLLRQLLKLPDPTTSIHVVDRSRFTWDLPHALEAWRTKSDDVTWVRWRAEFEYGESKYEDGEVHVGVKQGPDGELRIVAAEVWLAEFPEFDH